MEYRLIKSRKGIRYMKGAKFCKATDIPEDVLQRLHNQDTVDTSRDCVFCGQPGTEEKTLNSKRYYLCKLDYDTKTTGELAETIAKINASFKD